MLIVVILIGIAWIAFTILSYLHDLEPDPLLYGLVSVLFGILLTIYLYKGTTPTIEDYKSGNYKMKITTEIINGEVKSDTLYLKK